MARLIRSLVAACAVACAISGVVSQPIDPSPIDPASSVNTLIGAGGIGFQAGGIAPGPQVPYGAMRLSPDTSLDSLWMHFQHYGGYSYMDTHVRCFSHTHMVGAGVGDFGNFGVMAVGKPISQFSMNETAWYRSSFSHETETAVPGLWAAHLETPQVDVRLTATGTLSGVHEYSFAPRSDEAPSAMIVVDVCTVLTGKPTDDCRTADVEFTINEDQSITLSAHLLLHGALTGRSPLGGIDVYFFARIFPSSSASAVVDSGVWVDQELLPNKSSATTTSGSLGAYFEFGADRQNTLIVTMYTAISFINGSMAEANFGSQLGAIPTTGVIPAFDDVLGVTQQLWTDTLAVVQIYVDDAEVAEENEVDEEEEEEEEETIPSNAVLFNMTTFAKKDKTCSGPSTGSLQFSADQCVLTPQSVRPQYNSMQMSDVDIDSGNFTISIYMESPLCDDFVGWWTKGHLGTASGDCRTTLYFSFLVNTVNTSKQPKPRSIKASKPSSKKGKKAASQQPKKAPSSKTDGVQFYSLLYHSFLSPTAYTETGNLYLGFDGQVHEWNYTHADGSPSAYYSDLSLWDTFRTQNPLLGLLAPNVATDLVRSLYTMFSQGGDFPRWPLANVYTGCMTGSHGLVSLADWLSKDVTPESLDLDTRALLQAMIDMVDKPRAHGGRDDIANYTKIGYVPLESDSKATALTLEYALDDWAVGQVALLLGSPSDAQRLLKRSQNYHNVWEADRQLMCPRSINGSFACPSTLAAALPYPIETGYTEADAWQEVWFVPHDPAGLISLFPSPEAFVTKLTTFVEGGFSWIFPHEEIANSLYWAGNEPDILAPWLFNWAGRPDLTQNFTRRLLARRYEATPKVGLPGNDDYGAISAWATWAALGLYPQAGSTTYALGSPVYPKVVIHRSQANGGDLTILAPGTSDTRLFVKSVTINNGTAIQEPFVDHKQLRGATIQFTMSDAPSQQ